MNGASARVTALLNSGRPPHAILIEGTPGSERDAFVNRVVAEILCAAQGVQRPCGQCLACRKVAGDIHPDFLRYRGEGKSNAIPIDKVREIRGQAYLLPNESERKILLLEDADNMLPPAQNALLKILEEPPGCVIFILTVANRFRLLETVRSRVSAIALEPNAGQEETQPANPKYREDAVTLLESLSLGEESRALACLAGYEKDRGGLSGMLNETKTLALQSMLAGGYRGGGIPLSPLRLSAFVAIIEETIGKAQQNVGGLLLGCALSARLFSINN
ncbi:MAG: hypothetical protein FWE32_06200 [Oscillospiraceae bacterium]|nr:hypothetical protein [Oscillospiraceae bacterium]